ncbi:MAG: hypothetical protein GXP54_03020, partial [Deltaproteobacteria bacterium]|nr:hypothetical protein [Deltaproteobacteria bacterium]
MARRILIPALTGIMLFGLVTIGCSSGKRTGFALIEIEIDGKQFNPSTSDVKVDIGAIPVGSTRTFTITVANTGQDLNLDIEAISLDYTPQNDAEGPAPDNMSFYLRNVPPLPAFVAPTGEGAGDVPEFQTFQVVFKRFDDPIPRAAVVTISNNSKDSDKQELKISFETRKCDPKLSTPNQVDFGQVHEEQVKDIAISNTGSCGLVINGFIFNGHPDYTLIIGEQEYAGDQS